MRCPPQDEQAGDHEDVGGAVKDTVPARIELQILDRIDRIPAAQHVMPLQELMQHDAVEQPTQAQPKRIPAETGKCRSATAVAAITAAPLAAHAAPDPPAPPEPGVRNRREAP